MLSLQLFFIRAIRSSLNDARLKFKSFKKTNSYFCRFLLAPFAFFIPHVSAFDFSTDYWTINSEGYYGLASGQCIGTLYRSFSPMISCILSNQRYSGLAFTGMTYENSNNTSGYLNFQFDQVWGDGTTHTYTDQAVWVRGGNHCPAGQTLNTTLGQCIGKPKDAGNPQCGTNTAGTNPINVGAGNKFQLETDYINSSNMLVAQRAYNSDSLNRPAPWGSGWIGNYDRSLTRNAINNTALQAMRPDGKVYTYNLAGGVWTTDADVTNQLTQQTNSSGVTTGWTYRVAVDNSVESYNALGQLISITSRSGQAQTLTYSDGTTGVNGGYVLTASGAATTTTLPKALLIRVTDTFGHLLSFGYDSSGRVVKMIDPNGGVYFYSYDNSNTVTDGNLVSVTYPDTKIRSYLYNESVNTSGASLPTALTGVIDENGNRFATWKYDASGRAISSEHDLPGNVAVHKYSVAYTTDSNGNVSSSAVTDPFNTTRTYGFSTILGVSKNTGTSQPCNSGCGAASAISYDANGNISSKTDFNGNITNYSYDLTRNLETSRTEAYGTPQARTITTQWHATYRLPTLITESGKATAFSYDTSGNLLSKTITDTALNKSRTWSWTYNSLGQVLTADGPRTDVSDITTYTYYSSASSAVGSVHSIGDLATVTNALGQVTSITNYDLNGRPLSITDPNGIVTTLTYAPRGWLKTKTVNGAQTTTYDYDGVGQLIKATLPDNSYLSYTYDAAHRLTDVTDSSNNNTHYTLDLMDNRTKEETFDPSNALKKTRSRVYDALNRLQKDIGGTNSSTQITQYSYDNNGNLKTTTDPLNGVTTNNYDALNRLVQITDPANGIAKEGYNALDQKTSVTDPRNVVTNYTPNTLGDVTQTQSPDSGTSNAVYDAAGNITQKTDARGIVSNYTYDALNRLTSIGYPANAAENVSFTYDSSANGNNGIGKLTGYSNDGGATVLTYDAYGNVVQQTDSISSQIYTTSYAYDSANRVSQITYPSGRVVIYGRNSLGQITSVQTKDTTTGTAYSLISNASYYPFGPLVSLTYANSVMTSRNVDQDYRISRITTGSTPIWDFVYSYDAASNLLSQADQASMFSKTFNYDALYRVISDVNNTGTWTYQYDPASNRTKRINTSTQTLTYATTSNRMTKNGSTTQTLDAAGNLLTNGTKTYTYSNANRLLTYSVSGTVKAQMQYNAVGQRTAKLQITQPMHFHYDLKGQLIDTTQYTSAGKLAPRYEFIWLDDMPIAQMKTTYTTSGTVSARRLTYIHTDHLNTPRLMTDSTNKIVWRWDGDAYGATAPNQNPDGDSTTDGLNLRYPGQYADSETGLYYNYFRDYDPTTGRYLQSDPIGLEGGSWSTYSYVGGNPISRVDPLGLMGSAGGSSSSGSTSTGGDCDNKCRFPITINWTSGLGEPIYPVVTKTYSSACLATLGLIGKVGGVAVGNYVAGKIETGATSIAETASSAGGQTAARVVAGGARIFKSPVTTAVMAPVAAYELFEKCECQK